MNSHKPIGWKLLFDGFHTQLRHHWGTVDQVNLDIFVLAFNIFYVIQFDADEFVI